MLVQFTNVGGQQLAINPAQVAYVKAVTAETSKVYLALMDAEGGIDAEIVALPLQEVVKRLHQASDGYQMRQIAEAVAAYVR